MERLFFLAKHFVCHVEGISIVQAQINKANELKLNQNDFEHLVSFSCQDYCNTHFPDASFDVIVCIEVFVTLLLKLHS
mgnify:CR=1 FL=1